jgi:hypothetical protein
MKRPVPDLLSAILAVAAKTLDRPSGDLRRLDDIEKLFEETNIAIAGASIYINEWTLLLLRMMRKIEQQGPLGDPDTLQRAMVVAHAIQSFVMTDSLDAHRAFAAERMSTTDHNFKSSKAS